MEFIHDLEFNDLYPINYDLKILYEKRLILY